MAFHFQMFIYMDNQMLLSFFLNTVDFETLGMLNRPSIMMVQRRHHTSRFSRYSVQIINITIFLQFQFFSIVIAWDNVIWQVSFKTVGVLERSINWTVINSLLIHNPLVSIIIHLRMQFIIKTFLIIISTTYPKR